MELAFYIAGAVATAATIMTITRVNAVHALLYLIVSLLAVATAFYVLGAPFVAALEVIIYAGAIMVLFIFTVMMLNIGPKAVQQERELLNPGIWLGPMLLAAILLAEFGWLLFRNGQREVSMVPVTPKELGIALYGPYLLAVELASILMLGALVGAFHLSWRRYTKVEEDLHADDSARARADAGGDLVHAGDRGPAGQA
jgi:NADH-quinone oxidoreductase subunit J